MSLLETAIAVAREAGAVIMQHYSQRSVTVTSLKEDQSPVGSADLAACDLIRKQLSAMSKLPVITEEAPIEYKIRRDWTEFWLVDPLDGTKEFSAGTGEFAVNIALIKNGKPEIGVIFAPALDELFFAQSGMGAFVERGGCRVHLPCTRQDETVAARGRFQTTEMFDTFTSINNIVDIKILGASLKFCRLAEGVINIYPRYFPSKEWDIAAGHIIINEAQCYIFDATTMCEPLYNKQSFINSPFVACSKSISRETLKLLQLA